MGAKRARLTHGKTLLCRLYSIGNISRVVLTVVPAVFTVIYVAVTALAVGYAALSVIFAVISVRPSLFVCVIQAFLPAITNAVVHMTNRRARKFFAEVDNSSLQGPHPASSTAALTDNPLATADADAGYYTSWFYCTFTGSLMQINLAMPTSITDGHALAQLFSEDEYRQEIGTGEGDIDAFLD